MTKHEPPIIQIKNLWKEYGYNVVLEDRKSTRLNSSHN